MRAVVVVLTVLLCTAALAADVSARQIPSAELVVRPTEMPGFALAQRAVESTTSALRLATAFYNDKPSEVAADVARLKRERFQQAVQERFEYTYAYAESDASVFRSPQGARADMASDLRFLQALGFKTSAAGFAVPGVPGAIGVTRLAPPGRHDDVLFTTGRCFFVIFAEFAEPVTQEASRRAPIAGARELLKRVKGLCR